MKMQILNRQMSLVQKINRFPIKGGVTCNEKVYYPIVIDLYISFSL